MTMKDAAEDWKEIKRDGLKDEKEMREIDEERYERDW